jgi:hypothetical protein
LCLLHFAPLLVFLPTKNAVDVRIVVGQKTNNGKKARKKTDD